MFFSGLINLACTNILGTSMPSFLFTVLLCAFSLTSVEIQLDERVSQQYLQSGNQSKLQKAKHMAYRPSVRSRWLDIESPRIIIIYYYTSDSL